MCSPSSASCVHVHWSLGVFKRVILVVNRNAHTHFDSLINGKCTSHFIFSFCCTRFLGCPFLPARLKEGHRNRTTMAWAGSKMAIAPPLQSRVGSSVRPYSTMAGALADVDGGRSELPAPSGWVVDSCSSKYIVRCRRAGRRLRRAVSCSVQTRR